MYAMDRTASARRYYKEQIKKVESQKRIYEGQLVSIRNSNNWNREQKLREVKQLIRYCELQLLNCKSHLEGEVC